MMHFAKDTKPEATLPGVSGTSPQDVAYTRVVKKHMRPPDNSTAEVRLTVLDCELSGYDTDPSVWQGWETTGCFPYPGDFVPHCNEPDILARCDAAKTLRRVSAWRDTPLSPILPSAQKRRSNSGCVLQFRNERTRFARSPMRARFQGDRRDVREVFRFSNYPPEGNLLTTAGLSARYFN